MFVQIQCAFCGRPFDYDSSSDELEAPCPHCGKPNPVAPPQKEPPAAAGIADAPRPAGAKTCPSCRAQIGRDAVICIHCGYNFKTRQKTGGPNWFAANKGLIALVGGGLLAAAGGGIYLLKPEATPPPPSVAAAAQTAAAEPARPAPAPRSAAAAEPATSTPAATNLEPAAVDAARTTGAAIGPATPATPVKPTAEEIAAQKAAEERAALEARKYEAEQELRFRLDTREPLFVQNELVELRRKNGLVDKGTFSGLSGAGTNRVALVATPAGEIGVPLIALDNASRCRLDPEYREAFIQYLMKTKGPKTAPPDQAR